MTTDNQKLVDELAMKASLDAGHGAFVEEDAKLISDATHLPLFVELMEAAEWSMETRYHRLLNRTCDCEVCIALRALHNAIEKGRE